MCKIPDPPPPKMCRCRKRMAVYGDKCGHCYADMVDRVMKRSRRSRLVIGGPPR